MMTRGEIDGKIKAFEADVKAGKYLNTDATVDVRKIRKAAGPR